MFRNIMRGIIVTILMIISSYIYAYGFSVNLEKEFTVFEVKVSSVTFDYNGSSAIKMMDNTTDQELKKPEWVKGRNVTENEPAAYVKGTQFSVKVNFEVQPISIKSAKIWAVGDFGGLNSQASPVSIVFNNGLGEGTFTVNTPPNKTEVRNVAWQWRCVEVKSSSGKVTEEPVDIGTTQHEIYVTNANHATYVEIGKSIYAPFMFKTMAKWSCLWAQNADTNNDNILSNDEIILACFNGCASLSQIYVFPFPEDVPRGLNTYLDINQGACGEWAILLHDTIALQGVDTYDVVIELDPTSPTWGNHPSLVGEEEYCYYIEKPAMGGSTGPWIFSDHAFVMTGPGTGTVYDPTYHLSNSSGFGAYEDQVASKFTISIKQSLIGYPPGTGENIWNNPIGNNSHVYGYYPIP